MAAAAAAMDFGARHEEAAILRRADGPGDGGIEARPARAAIELRRGRENRLATACAMIDAGALLAVEGARPGPLRAVLAQDVVLGRRARRPPLLVALLDRNAPR